MAIVVVTKMKNDNKKNISSLYCISPHDTLCYTHSEIALAPCPCRRSPVSQVAGWDPWALQVSLSPSEAERNMKE